MAGVMTKPKDLLFEDTTPLALVQIDYGFVIIIFNAATHYITISKSGVMNDNIVGSDHVSFDSIYYENGIIYGKGKGSIQLGTIIYTPNGSILV